MGKTDFIEDPAAVVQHLPGCRIVAVRRHGKFLVFDLEGLKDTPVAGPLLIHLGMTGQLLSCAPEVPVAPHTHVFFALDDGRELRYRDVRRFGSIRLSNGEADAGILGDLGLDPLESSEDEFRARLAGRRARIKALLLDQHVLRGMGNIYTDESLWRARINPMRLGANLTGDEVRRLYLAMREVLTEAIRLRGSSISDYVDSAGERGGFQRRHRVYQRQGKKCGRCGAIIRHAVVAGRSTHFCPGCQPTPRVRRKRRRT